MVNLSKSKYCALWQCPKMLWLRKYKPELAAVDSHTLSIMETGNAVGDLAMGLFGDFTEVTVYTDGEIDLPAMMRRTQEEIAKDTPVICEASFEWNGLYCAVDILRREDGTADGQSTKSKAPRQMTRLSISQMSPTRSLCLSTAASRSRAPTWWCWIVTTSSTGHLTCKSCSRSPMLAWQLLSSRIM